MRTAPRGLLAAGLAGLALGLAGLAPASPALADETASDAEAASHVVRAALDEALAVLRDGSLTSAQRVAKVENIAWKHFDFPTMSRLVLARAWRRFTPEQREAFQQQFRTLLSRRYGRRLERYRDERVEITETRPEPRGDVTVRTVILDGQYQGVVIDYRMRRESDTWRAIDVVIEGVSLVGSYRSQFQDLLQRKTPDQLIELLREKNARPADQADDEEPS